MLIRDAEVEGRRIDVRCRAGRLSEIGEQLPVGSSEPVLEAAGGALLPGLHDHHLHLLSLAAALDSVPCGPPRVTSERALARALREARPDERGWLRGVDYHESVAGPLDRRVLDALRADVPVRIQHRSGSMWFLNSRALEALALDRTPGGSAPDGVERDGAGRATGRLFRLDDWLRARLPRRSEPDLAPVGAWLARVGVTGVSDATPSNDRPQAERLRAAQRRGALPQRVFLMGGRDLDDLESEARLAVGPVKILLDEPALPDLQDLIADVQAAHDAGRAVAIHCVTRTELHFALAALESAGPRPGDRLEHASVAPDESLALARALALCVVTQPNFLAERGDVYRREVDARDRPFLYRLRSWLEAGVPLGGGTDAPFGEADPWRAMQAAVDRRTACGAPLGERERISPEAALALFTTDPRAPGGAPRRVAVGERADLVLLDLPWSQARRSLSRERVRVTLVDGEPVGRGPI